MPRITISYRRDDSGVITGRIFDRLAAHYGREAVFRDIDNIPPGSDFREQIAKVLDESDILLAIVGPRWLGARGGRMRLSDESDPVRLEIETGLRKRMPVIPVLVLKATMPRAAQLPDTIKDFAFRHAVQVDAGEDFDVHSARLIRAMDRILLQDDVGAADAGRIVGEVMTPSEAVAEWVSAEATNLANTADLHSAEAAVKAVPEELRDGDNAPTIDGIVSSRAHRQGRLGVIVGTAAVGAIIVAAVLVMGLRSAAPPDVMALAAAKDEAEGKALALEAELTATKKKTAALQDNLDAAQVEASKQVQRLATLQADRDQATKDLAAQKNAADTTQTQIDQLKAQVKSLGDQATRAANAEAARNQLASQLAAAQAQLKTVQSTLDQQAAELKDAQARADKDQRQLADAQDKSTTVQNAQLNGANLRADQALKELASQKDEVAKAQARFDGLQAQVNELSNQLATEQKRRVASEALASQLRDQVSSLERNQSPAPIASQAALTTEPSPGSDDATWSAVQRQAVQADLITLGHLQGVPDGNFGPASRTAIKQFQAFDNDPETGSMTDAEAHTLHDMATRLAAQMVRGETSPEGVTASTIKGAALRYQHAWAAEKGGDGKPNPGEAVYWYGLAARDGDAKAFTNLGLLLARGQGVPNADLDDAALLWWAAASRGETVAMFNLGTLWENGIGVVADLAKAKAWYQRAAAKGDPEAQAALKRLGA